jgi:hypothetical protein
MFDEVLLCANQSLRWPQFSRLAVYRFQMTRSLAGLDTAAATLRGMVRVVTSQVNIAAAFSRVDMTAVSGTADGGVMALVHAGNGQTPTASTFGSVINP